jgi:hypothetical protein
VGTIWKAILTKDAKLIIFLSFGNKKPLFFRMEAGGLATNQQLNLFAVKWSYYICTRTRTNHLARVISYSIIILTTSKLYIYALLFVMYYYNTHKIGWLVEIKISFYNNFLSSWLRELEWYIVFNTEIYS